MPLEPHHLRVRCLYTSVEVLRFLADHSTLTISGCGKSFLINVTPFSNQFQKEDRGFEEVDHRIQHHQR